MKRFQSAVDVARVVSNGFFAEVFAQLGIVKNETPETKIQKNSSEDLNLGKEVASGVNHEFEVAQISVMIQIGDCYVDLRLYKDRVTRLMKKPCADGRSFERVGLSDYTPDVAYKTSRPFNLAEAVEFTKNEFGVPSKATVKPTVKFTDAPKKAVWNTPKPEHCESTEPGLAKVSKGKVVFAGKSTVTPKDKSPYTTFTVILQTATGAEIKNSGVELENLFLAGKFLVGDDVVLEKKVEAFDQEIGGVKMKGIRNSYAVNVL